MAKGKFNGFGGGMNMQAMMRQAQKMQENMLNAKDEIAKMETEAASGGGAVKVKLTGTDTVTAVELKPEVVDPDDIEMLQDLIMAAVNEALKSAKDKSANKMNEVTGGMGGSMGGLF